MNTMQDCTIYCTPEQTKKALELGAPIDYVDRFNENLPCELIEFTDSNGKKMSAEFVIPTAEQMLNWLRSERFYFRFDDYIKHYLVIAKRSSFELITKGNLDNEEAVLAAIDAALDYLEKEK